MPQIEDQRESRSGIPDRSEISGTPPKVGSLLARGTLGAILMSVSVAFMLWLAVVQLAGPYISRWDDTGIFTYWREYVSSGFSFGLALTVFVIGLFLRIDPIARIDRSTRQSMRESNDPFGVELIEPNIQGDLHIHYPAEFDQGAAALAREIGRSAEGLRQQERILREIYTVGLIHAKTSFIVSMLFAGVGALLLFIGVGLAVFKAGDDGGQYASIVTALSGTVVTITSSLFFVQTNSTRKAMGEQAVMMREESRSERQINTAREMLTAITNEEERDKLQASMATRLIDLLAGSQYEDVTK